MRFKNSPGEYSLFSRFLHWFTAITIIGLLALGLYMTELERSPFMFTLYGLHKSLGVLVLSLGLIRLVWHFISSPPRFIGNPTPSQKRAAITVHFALIGAMILLPLSGWIMSSTGGYDVNFFELFTLPNFTGKNHALHELFEIVHEYGAYTLIGLIALHAGAALYHHYIKKDDTLKRMTKGLD